MARAPQPWERQPGEPAKAFAAFCAYRDLPLTKRSVRLAAEGLRGVPTTRHGRASNRAPRGWQAWHKKFDWQARAAAWDNEQDRVSREELARQRIDMARRHAQIGRDLLTKGHEAVKAAQAVDIDARVGGELVERGAKLERLALGEPTERSDVQVSTGDRVASILSALFGDEPQESVEVGDLGD